MLKHILPNAYVVTSPTCYRYFILPEFLSAPVKVKEVSASFVGLAQFIFSLPEMNQKSPEALFTKLLTIDMLHRVFY